MESFIQTILNFFKGLLSSVGEAFNWIGERFTSWFGGGNAAAETAPAGGAPARRAEPTARAPVQKKEPVALTETEKNELKTFAEKARDTYFTNSPPGPDMLPSAEHVELTRAYESAVNNLNPDIGASAKPFFTQGIDGRLVFNAPQNSRIYFRQTEDSISMPGGDTMIRMGVQSMEKDRTGTYAFAEKFFDVPASWLEKNLITFKAPKLGEVDFYVKKGALPAGTTFVVESEGAVVNNRGVDMILNGVFRDAKATYKPPIISESDKKILGAVLAN